ncbi:GYDIA family GHMP kinase [Myroides sp. WP-1]|uniref:GYDIA family GHMP kinase n=1 Tax=Myroides sp. WP-1 TaxID=2759944 RepID=UPI0015FA5F2A|nr:GYDIA family GHMP kinase [Myroides sp. WP-1]MBB1139600.1 GHMP kinase [Myroides sp. WP-1]
MDFYSPGKLLIAGEYVVLDGAKAFALPTAQGQSMHVESIAQAVLYWTSYDVDGKIWMQEQVAMEQLLKNEEVTGSAYLQTLVDVLRAAHSQNPTLLQSGGGFRVRCELTFPRLWGLGTSSTWINNVAQWFDINPYQLLQDSFGGSGYDIACAKHNSPLFYQLTDPVYPSVDLVEFQPIFHKNIYFVYLNEKQSSKEAIQAYRSKKGLLSVEIKRISEISQALVTATSVGAFAQLIREHEAIIGRVLGIQPVQERLFPDFNGTIKSLGAWGGDFVLVLADENPTAYFTEKGYTTILPYEQMIAK